MNINLGIKRFHKAFDIIATIKLRTTLMNIAKQNFKSKQAQIAFKILSFFELQNNLNKTISYQFEKITI